MSNSQDLESLVTRVARPPKRRTWQVSLRWLLIVMALCAAYFGGRSSRQQELLELQRQLQETADALKRIEQHDPLYFVELKWLRPGVAADLRQVHEVIRNELYPDKFAVQNELAEHMWRVAEEQRKQGTQN